MLERLNKELKQRSRAIEAIVYLRINSQWNLGK
jgi:hypothetical protein